ncbi:hypothetical protein GCM10010191_19110 [Actinomadura vinacea]|uniref:Uncharacterized protein n=1 Tax=Actinomadura vinacea TaxID=115336 RepID=A0ABN3IR34_9ACTN
MSQLVYLIPGWILLLGVYGIVTSRNLVHAVESFTRLPAPPPEPWTVSGVATGLLGVALAAAVAACGIRGRLPRAALLRRLHSGHVGDYVAWLVAGVTLFCLLLLT